MIQELRIGNYVEIIENLEKCNAQILSVGSNNFCDLTYNRPYTHFIGRYTGRNISDIKPIPITDDILLKCGFDKNDNMFTDNKLVGIEIYDEDLHFRVLCGNYCLCVINNLHQLQNLYYALTGEELNIKL